MIDHLISFSIKNKLIIGLLTVALIIGGIWSMLEVPIDAVPDITNNQVQVITTAPNLATEDIEQFVTYPVELAMANLPGVLEIRSISRFGLSVVTIVFEDDMGTYLPRQLVNEKLDEIKGEIPEGFGKPFMGPITTGLGEIFQYTLDPLPEYEAVYTDIELRTIQDWIIQRQMAMVPGVVEVNSFGGKIKQYEVAVDPDRLKAMGVTITEVFSALAKNNQNTGGAYIEKDHKANFIRGEGLARSLDELEKIVVKNVRNVPILIRDVAEPGIGHAVRYGSFTKDGKGEAVGGMIMMLKGANSDEVISAVKERMAQIEKSLPEGLEINPFLDRSELISRTTLTVATNLTEGGLIVIFVLVLLLGNFRGGLIVASTIPLSLLFAFILMNIFDVWANLMSLGAIDFGIIVDGAVIIVESTVFVLSQRMQKTQAKINQPEKDEIARISASRMMNSAFFGQLIILIVFAPILALEGVEGKMFKPMALTFGFAMLGAMLLCLTYVPMMSAWFLTMSPKQRKPGWGDNFVAWLKKRYEPLLLWSLRKKSAILLSALLLFIVAIWTFTRMGGEFIPQLEEGDIAFHAILKPGSSLTEMIHTTTEIEKKLLNSFPEIEHVLGRAGVSSVPTDPMPMDIADIFVILKPKSEWVSANTKDELIDKIKQKVLEIPGVNYEFTQPIEMRFNELITGVREDIAVKLYGEDLYLLAEKAEQMGRLIATVEGVGDMRVEATTGLPQMTVKFDREKVALYGLNIQELNQYIRSAFAGGSAGQIFEGEKRFDLVVRLGQEHRQNIENLQNLYVNLDNGHQIPLKEIAQISYLPGPMQISRDNTNRRVYVGVNVRGRDVQSLVEEIKDKLENQLEIPPGYYIRYGGAFENLERASNRLQLVVPLALALIFMLLYFALRSFRQTFMIYIAIPLAAIGGVFSLWIRDMPFSISAGVGFIVLFGVAVLNGLVLISSLNELKSEGVTNIISRIREGTKNRVRPILLTASTDILGFLPMAISTSAGAEVQRPLATVVIGGLITSTLLTLLVLPVLYHWVENVAQSKFKASLWALLPVAFASIAVIPGRVQAQSPPVLTLDSALSITQSRYPAIQSAQLEIEKQEKLKKASWNLGKTQIFTGKEEVGNGSEGVETLVGFQQQYIDIFSSNSRSKWRDKLIDQRSAEKKLTELEIMQQTASAYHQASYAKSKWLLANELEGIYSRLEAVARLRYEQQETSRLEWLSASGRYQKVKISADQARADHEIALAALNRWLRLEDPFEVQQLSYPDLLFDVADTFLIQSSPLINASEAEIRSAEAYLKTQQSELLPKFTAMYGLQKVNDQSGFSTYQFGIQLPLWFLPQKGGVEAARLDKQIAENKQKELLTNVESSYQQLVQEQGKVIQLLQFYQQSALPLAEEQIRAATKSYRFGETDYMDYIQTLNEAMNTKREYNDHLLQYHQIINQINFISGQF